MDPFEHADAATLLCALADEDYATRVRAACAIGDQLRFRKLQCSNTLRDALRTILIGGRSSQSSHPPPIPQPPLSGEWDDLRFEAAIALCEAGDAEGERLIGALQESTRRFDALKALSRLPPSPALHDAVARVFDKWFLYWPDRIAAAGVLSLWSDARAQQHFENTLGDRKRKDRRALAVHLLGDLRMPQAFERLTKIAEDESDPARGAAIRALGHLYDPRTPAWLTRQWPEELIEDMAYARALFADSAV